MEFKHLNQPDFDRERDEVVDKLCPLTAGHHPLWVIRLAYNEGYKKALRDWSIWKDGVQRIGCMEHDIKEVIADVDKIDKETLEIKRKIWD